MHESANDREMPATRKQHRLGASCGQRPKWGKMNDPKTGELRVTQLLAQQPPPPTGCWVCRRWLSLFNDPWAGLGWLAGNCRNESTGRRASKCSPREGKSRRGLIQIGPATACELENYFVPFDSSGLEPNMTTLKRKRFGRPAELVAERTSWTGPAAAS